MGPERYGAPLRKAALIRIGSPAVPKLVSWLADHGDGDVIAVLGAIGPQAAAAVPQLEDLLQSSDGEVKWDVAIALRQIQPDHARVVRLHRESLVENDNFVHAPSNFFVALYLMGEPFGVVLPHAEGFAPMVLEEYRTWADLSDHRGSVDAEDFAKVLASLGENSHVTAGLEDPRLRLVCLMALEIHGPPAAALPTIVGLLADSDEFVRGVRLPNIRQSRAFGKRRNSDFEEIDGR